MNLRNFWGLFLLWGMLGMCFAQVNDDTTKGNIVGYRDIVVLNITTNSGDSPAGAIITLTNRDGNPDHVYTLVAPSNGVITHDIWNGTYDITGRLAHFDDYSQSGVEVSSSTTEINIQFNEALRPIANLCGAITPPHAITLYWLSPYAYGDEFIESFEGGDVPDDWTVVQTSTDDSQAVPAWWTVTDYANTTYSPALVPSDGDYHAGLWWSDEPQDEWLITPEFLCGANTSLSFKSYIYWGSSHNDHYYVKVSADHGSTWNILWDASDFAPEGWNGYGDPYVVSLGDYVGQQIEVAFHALGPDGLYSVWFIDEVEVSGGNRSMVLPENNGVREISRNVGKGQRNLLGYRFERDGVVLAALWPDTSYTDTIALSGTHTYSIRAVYTTGISEAMSIIFPPIGTEDYSNTEPAITTLTGNSPNPFNPTTTIAYSLATSEPVSLTVYNLRGQKATTLVNDTQSAGKHTVTWNGTDANGHSVASGVYFYRMEAGNYSATQKMMLLK